MATSADDAILHQNTSLTFRHPLWELGTSWDDEHMSATMEWYLNGYQDSRISSYFQATHANGAYIGFPHGMVRPATVRVKANTSLPNVI